MGEVFTKNFHAVDRISAQGRKLYILDKWAPKDPLQVIGAQLGLLCCFGTNFELYISCSRSPKLKPEDWMACLKKDYLFYAQRDAYDKPIGISDILENVMLPSNSYFVVSEDNPIYVKVGVINELSIPSYYDAFVNFYYERV